MALVFILTRPKIELVIIASQQLVVNDRREIVAVLSNAVQGKDWGFHNWQEHSDAGGVSGRRGMTDLITAPFFSPKD